jgi:prepilin signal peptidase PulO-like enzyme (type II secretory pathway)
MRTITKMRLPAYGFIAMVLLTALSGSLWVMAGLMIVLLAGAAWFPARCPQCGEIAGYTKRQFLRPYISFRGICVRCGADFFKV